VSTAPAPTPVRIAAGLVGLEGLAGLVMAVVFGVWSEGSVGSRIGEASYFLLVAVALGCCAVLLFRGHHGARTPAIVTQLLLVPVVYTTLGSGQIVVGIVALLFVVGTFLLLISEPSRRWAVGADEASRSE
jgi:uncharacterized membrane protein YhaH (DUF805 family)